MTEFMVVAIILATGEIQEETGSRIELAHLLTHSLTQRLTCDGHHPPTTPARERET